MFKAILTPARKRTVAAWAGSTWTLGALVFVLTWGGAVATPLPQSLDISTHAGLAMARTMGLDHGGDIVFSYGPLGFLKSYLTFYVWPARLALLYGAGLHLALSLTLVWAARRSFPLVVAVGLALVAAMLLRGDLAAIGARMDAAVVVLAFIWCVAALDDDSPDWVRRLVIYGGGPFAALELMAKLNTGAIVLGLVAVTVVALERERWRNIVTVAGSFAVTVVVVWLATGQGLGDVEPYVTGARDLVSGYSTSAYFEWTTRDYDYVLGPVAIALVGVMAFFATREAPTRRRWGILAMFAGVAFASWKAGFVAHEVNHMTIFYSTMIGAAFAFRPPPGTGATVAAAVGVAALGGAALTANFDGYPMANPVANVRDAVTTATTFAVPGRLEDEITEARTNAVAGYGIDPHAVELLGEGGVHVDSGEATAVWALGVEWRPLPVYQSYAAWTPELDERNAEALAAPDGPDRILREVANPLGRYPGFESPAAVVAMLCNFESLWADARWQVLGRVADRCGAEEPLTSVEARVGEAIAVPETGPGELLLARVDGIEPSGLERAVSVVYRARPRSVVPDSSGRRYVFTAATAQDGLLLRAPASADYPSPFTLAPNAATITFLRDGEATGDELTVDFSTVDVVSSAHGGEG